MFENKPRVNQSIPNGKVPKYTHQPLTIDHYGIHCKIQENGRILLSQAVNVSDGSDLGDVIEYDEIEIPASLVFKLAGLLRDTRKTEYVDSAVQRGAGIRDEQK